MSHKKNRIPVFDKLETRESCTYPPYPPPPGPIIFLPPTFTSVPIYTISGPTTVINTGGNTTGSTKQIPGLGTAHFNLVLIKDSTGHYFVQPNLTITLEPNKSVEEMDGDITMERKSTTGQSASTFIPITTTRPSYLGSYYQVFSKDTVTASALLTVTLHDGSIFQVKVNDSQAVP